MAAFLHKGGGILCVRCLHRELCRLVWRPQKASFSTKQSNGKQSRRTHIKKAKPQPELDVAKLLEKLYSQRRPGTAPSAASSRPAQVSTNLRGHPAASSKSASTSSVGPVSQPHTVPQYTPKTPLSHQDTPASSTQASTAAAAAGVSAPLNTTPVPPQAVSTHTSEEESVEPQSPAGTSEDKVDHAISAGDPTAAGAPSASTSMTRGTSTEDGTETSELEPLTSKLLDLETSGGAAGQNSGEVAIEAAEGTTGLVEGEIISGELSVDMLTQQASTSPVEAQVGEASTAEGSETPAGEATVGAGAPASSSESPQELESEPMMEELRPAGEPTASEAEVLTMEPGTPEGAEAAIETLQCNAAAAKLSNDVLEETEAAVSNLTDVPVAADEESITLESRTSAGGMAEVRTLDTEVEEEVGTGKVEVTPVVAEAHRDVEEVEISTPGSQTEATDALEAETSVVLEALFCPDPQPRNVDAEEASQDHPESNWQEVDMSLESLTLGDVTSGVGGLEIEAPEEMTATLVKEVEKAAEQASPGVVPVTRRWSASEESKAAEILTLESLTEAADALESEASILMEAMICSDAQPRQLPDPLPGEGELLPSEGATLQGSETELAGQDGTIQENQTLELDMLANVAAGEGILDPESPQETVALEGEAEMAAKQEEMEMEVEPLEASAQVEMISKEGHEASVGQDGGALEATVLDLEMLVEAEASSGVQESQTLGETTNHVAEEVGEKVEMEMGSGAEPEETRAAPSSTLQVEEEFGTDTEDNEEVREAAVGDSEVLQTKSGEEEERMGETLTQESLTMAEVDHQTEISEVDVSQQEETSSVQTVVGETEEPKIPNQEEMVEEEVQTKAEVLSEAAEEDHVQQTLTCPIPEIPTAQETDGTAAIETDAPLCSLTTEEAGLAETEGTGTPDVMETQADLDPVQRLFLDKIREYRQHSGSFQLGPDYEKLLEQETAKLQRLYGGGDLSSFPHFTFTEPKMDQES